MVTRLLLCGAIALCTLAWAGCSDDSGNGDSDDDGDGQTLEPGREVAGCFDCSATEYCMLFVGGDGETETYRCAEASCGLECDCIKEDGAKRHAECKSYSCQGGSGLLYCTG